MNLKTSKGFVVEVVCLAGESLVDARLDVDAAPIPLPREYRECEATIVDRRGRDYLARRHP